MSELLERLRRGPPILLDGGLGTALIARGLAPGDAPEAWNVRRPGDVEAVHRAFVEAGSEAVQTNTFGATPVRLAALGSSLEAFELNRVAVRLARAAGARFVVGSIGPTGTYLPPVGNADPATWRASFELQGRALAEAGVDGFHVETMSDLREALTALDALQRVAPSTPVMVSLAFERKRRGFFTLMGDALAPSLAALAAAGAAAVGSNCSVASADLRDLEREAKSAVPLVLKPNAGRPDVGANGACKYLQSPESFAEDMAEFMESRAVGALGGCCGTDPRFITELLRLRTAARVRAE